MVHVTKVSVLQKPVIKPIRAEIKLRNNLILTKMEERGITSLVKLAKAAGCEYKKLIQLVAMKLPAISKQGSWQKDALLLSDFFLCMPEELFSADQQVAALETNRVQAEIDFAEIQLLSTIQSTPDKIAEAKELKNLLRQALMKLTPREHRVMLLLYGLDGAPEHTQKEVANIMSITAPRVFQIEAKALRKLKYPVLSDKIAAAGGYVRQKRPNNKQRLDNDTLEVLSQV